MFQESEGVLGYGTNSQAISDEIDMLGKLHDVGVPTVNPQAVSLRDGPRFSKEEAVSLD